MKAAIVESAGRTPVYGEFAEPLAADGEIVVAVTAAPLSQITRLRASGTHYSSTATFPFVVGLDGAGRRADGTRIYFLMVRAPFGSMAERAVVRGAQCVPIPDAMDDVTAAAIAIPAMSSWLPLTGRARLSAGQVVLVNGATGISGRLAVQIARHLGAGKIIATGRDGDALGTLNELGADVVISLAQEREALTAALIQHIESDGADVILDYVWGPAAECALAALSRLRKNIRATRFVQIGSASAPAITLPYAPLRSYPLEMIGSGIGSVPSDQILKSVTEVLHAAAAHGFRIATKAVPLAKVESQWAAADARSRTVFVTESL